MMQMTASGEQREQTLQFLLYALGEVDTDGLLPVTPMKTTPDQEHVDIGQGRTALVTHWWDPFNGSIFRADVLFTAASAPARQTTQPRR
jgi:hypothetical protein